LAVEQGDISKQVVHDMYAAGMSGDVEGMLKQMAEDAFVLHEPSFLPYGGEYRGRAGMIEAFTKIGSRLDVGAIEIDRVVAEGERVFVVMRTTDLGSGEQVLIAEENLVRDGQIVEMRVYFHEARSLVARA
jgi:ketosteroid isomerase-like protein